MPTLTRRKAMTALAAVPAIAAVDTANTSIPGAGELAAKIRQLKRNWEGMPKNDAEADRYWKTVERPFYKTFPGVPARSAEDALAAFDYLIEEDLIEHGSNGYEKVTQTLVKAIRDYLSGRVA